MTDKKQAQATTEPNDLTKAQEEALEIGSDTVKGGRYLDTDGKTLVDANGKPIKDSK